VLYVVGYCFEGDLFLPKIVKKFLKRSVSDLAAALSLMGAMLVFIGILSLFGIVPFIQFLSEGTTNFGVTYGWIIRVIGFLVVGVVLAVIGNKWNNGSTPFKAVVAFLAVPALFFSLLFLLGFGIRDFLFYELPYYYSHREIIPLSPIERFGWIGGFVIFALLFLESVIYLKRNASPKALKPLISSLRIGGGIFLAIALISFIFGLTVLTTTATVPTLEQIAKSLLEPITYGVIGAACFLVRRKLKK
jgi:hypothetical protein